MPNKRQFRLEPVLRVRQQREKQLQGEMARTFRRQMDEQALLSQMHENRQTQLELLSQHLTAERVEMTYVQFGHAYLERLQSLVDRQSNVVKQAARATEKKRVQVVQAMKSRKVIDKLKEHWWECLLEEEQQRELKIMDEISTVQFNHRERDEQT